jgi:pyruvate/2-oxoglutarate dehydrogenase complex dihydrolipoamide dehydrogenase (E3) component
VAYLARRGAEYGVETGDVRVDLRRVRERKRAIVESFRGGSERRIRAAPGLELVYGEARFTGPRTVAVDGRTFEADLVFINTGGRPADPDVEGLDRVGALDSTSIMELEQVPEHLLVLGGGYIGLEFAQMFRRFGSRVTVVQRGRQLLPLEDEDIAAAVLELLRQDGIDVLLESSARCAEVVDGRSAPRRPHGREESGRVGSVLLAGPGAQHRPPGSTPPGSPPMRRGMSR